MMIHQPTESEWTVFGTGEPSLYQAELRQHAKSPADDVQFTVTGLQGFLGQRNVDPATPGATVFFIVQPDAPLPRKTHLLRFITDGQRYAYPYAPLPDREMDLAWDWDALDQQRVLAAIRDFANRTLS